MGEVNLVIDGTEVKAQEGVTILEAATEVGIDVPTLCHRPDLTPTGACRVCVVESEGSKALVASCHTPVAEGMVIRTNTRRVIEARKAVVELMLAAHTGPCATCDYASECELHKLASDLQVAPPRFHVRQRRSYLEEISPYVKRDLSKCIMCRRCVRACAEVAKKNVFSIGYRGFGSKIVVDFDQPLNKDACNDCGICIDYCPTGALTRPREESEEHEATATSRAG